MIPTCRSGVESEVSRLTGSQVMLMLVQEPHLGTTAVVGGSFLSSRMEIMGEKELGDNY